MRARTAPLPRAGLRCHGATAVDGGPATAIHLCIANLYTNGLAAAVISRKPAATRRAARPCDADPRSRHAGSPPRPRPSPRAASGPRASCRSRSGSASRAAASTGTSAITRNSSGSLLERWRDEQLARTGAPGGRTPGDAEADLRRRRPPAADRHGTRRQVAAGRARRAGFRAPQRARRDDHRGRQPGADDGRGSRCSRR